MNGQEIVKQINVRLAEIGMTKQTFSQLTGISRSSISQWNTGRNLPSDDAIRKINDVLGTHFELSNKTDNMYDTIQMLQNMRDCDRFVLDAARAVEDEETVMEIGRILLKFKRKDENVD